MLGSGICREGCGRGVSGEDEDEGEGVDDMSLISAPHTLVSTSVLGLL